ncbi:MAG: hypothetical protein LQ340_002643 [Diploschistes diacapsis]|nr:MAG: hypothetical protein LQ340_002643 [Diploschistes diacapsis]
MSLDSLTCPRAKYLVGWSHGKESLRPGVSDTLKGSYYVNCAFYHDTSISAAPAASFPDLPEYTTPNIWPFEDLLPGFRATFQELCTLIIDTAVLVARACDRYGKANVPHYQQGYLERVVQTSFTTKARLLHYFPPAPSTRQAESTEDSTDGRTPDAANGAENDDDWCATHLDHGCLTGLTSALFVDESKPLPSFLPPSYSHTDLPPVPYLAASPDPRAGLYIRSRTGTTTKISIPSDCLAFQTGEALEKITCGRFRAVPHFVRAGGKGMEGVARNTLAVFTQPNLGEVVDPETGMTFAEFARGVVGRNTVR